MFLNNINTGIAAFINPIVKHADGTFTDYGTFKNLILDTFFARFAANNSMTQGGAPMLCRVGTGTTPPVNGDTSLVSAVASQAATTSTEVLGSIDITNNRIIAKSIRQCIFATGAVNTNIAEIGFEFAPSSGGLHAGSLNSRSLTKNSFGVPTAIPVTATDQLIVNYTIEVYVPMVDYTTTIPLDIDGVITNHDIIGRIAGAYDKTTNDILLGAENQNNWLRPYGTSATFGAHGADPTPESGIASGTSQLFTSVSGGKEKEFSASVNQLNAVGGLKIFTLAVGSSGRFYKYQITPPIPKTTDFNLKIRVRMTCTRV